MELINERPHPGQAHTLTRPAATLSHPMGEGQRIVRHPLENSRAGICRSVTDLILLLL